MKRMMMAGGLCGFGIGIAFGMAQGSTWSVTFWRASVTAYLAGLLFRWWGQVWLQGLKQAHAQRLANPPESPAALSANPSKS